MSESVPESLRDQTFRGRSLRDSRFVGCDLGGVVVRGSDVDGMEIDSPWLLEGGSLLVNGVDVVPLVDAELNRRFPGRELRTAQDAAGLGEAWAAVERAWEETVGRARALPEGATDASVAGEWSFTQTLRHLVMATDTWLGKALLGREQPYHPLGLPDDSFVADGGDGSIFSATDPSLDEVLQARADRQAMVRETIAGLSEEDLAEPRPNPHAPEHQETVRSCLGTILEEEWEHHRYAVRDLDAIEAGRTE